MTEKINIQEYDGNIYGYIVNVMGKETVLLKKDELKELYYQISDLLCQ